MIPGSVATKGSKEKAPLPKVVLGEPEAVKLYLEEDKTEEYTPVDITYRVDRNTGVAMVTLNRPESLNALQPVLLQEIIFVLVHVSRDPAVKALIFTGSGRAFSAGASLKPRTGKAVKFPKHVIQAYRKRGQYHEINDIALKAFTLAHWDCTKIVIGAINGLAVGGAANMSLANFYDFTICSEEAKFKYPFSQLGITPELGSSFVLPYVTGMARAKELLMVDKWFSAHDAVRFGLAMKVVPHDNLMPAAFEFATVFTTNPKQEALRRSKELLNRHMRERMAKVLDQENVEIRRCVMAARL